MMTGKHEFVVETRTTPTICFFGVNTEKSSSRKMFPRWAQILGLGDARLVGINLPINGPMEDYRRAVYQIRHDPLSLGAIITTHKINTLAAARDLLDELTPDAELTSEVSSLYKRGGRLIGHATDPAASGQSMQQFIPRGYWQQSGASILCLGAGGSATAIAAYFTRKAAPENWAARIIFVDRSQQRLDALRHAIQTKMSGTAITFEFVHNSDPVVNDQIMETLPPGSLVINATGMGKDIPGSPITGAGRFPVNGIAWDLNYRGELDFLRQARQQSRAQNLKVVDGWYYFLVGWATILGQVFDVAITPERFTQLAAAAEAIRQ